MQNFKNATKQKLRRLVMENKNKPAPKKRGRPRKEKVVAPKSETPKIEVPKVEIIEDREPTFKATPVVPKTETPETPVENETNIPEVDLSDILSQKTEIKHLEGSGKSGEDNGEEKETTPPPNDSDFGGEIETPETPPEPGQAPEPEPEKKTPAGSEYAQSAKIVIASLESLGELGLPYAYSKKLFSAEEKKYLDEVKSIASYLANPKAAEAMYATMPEEKATIIRGLYPKYKKYERQCEGIKFNTDERTALVNPLTEVFEKYDIGMGCEVALIVALFTVLASRLAPIFF